MGVALCALVAAADAAGAQGAQIAPLPVNVSVPADAKMFMEADTVVYESNTGVVTATGGVQLDYGGYKLVARKVVYDQNSRRLVAAGDVQLVQPDGNVIYTDSADITDDFADGFLRALRIESPNNTRFAAQGAVRENGNLLTLEKGVYTACQACREHPERAPLWQVKARKIVWDQQKKVIRYYGASLEFFGLPLAYLPYISQPDPTVKRKSGFLIPQFRQSQERGFGLRVPYFFALSDSYDATVAGTYYSKQGFLGEVEFRQAFGNGYYTLQAAGLSQQDPHAFNLGTPDYENVDRGMIGTTGRFAINDKWTAGWDILAQSDQNFSNTYDIENFNQTFHTSEIYLTGLGDRSFFDLRAQRFDIQTDDNNTDDGLVNGIDDQDVQPWVYPTLDYERIEDGVAGGELQLNANLVNLTRESADRRASEFLLCDPDFFDNGFCSSTAALNAGVLSGFPYRTDYFRRRALEGDYSRGTLEAEWRRTFTTDGGLLLTPFGSLRGDLYRANMSTGGYPYVPTDINLPVSGTNPYLGEPYPGAADIDGSGFRGMATAGLEARYPILFEAKGSTHVLEPIGQLLVRPNETDVGNLPNEDAQSLVFNTTNLFTADKFSGYDRIEGGTRANVGLRYSGTYDTGYTVNAVLGESFHLAGKNPYKNVDLALVGPDSGLESDRSDYVASLAVGTPIGIGFGVGTRLDEDTLDVRRTDFSGTYANSRLGLGVTYSQIAAQPIYGFPEDRSQAGVSASLKLTDVWTAYGSLGYDIKNDAVISKSLGFGYLDECFSLLAQYTQTDDRYQLSDSQNQIMFKLSLRTVADADYTYKLDNNN